MFELQIRLKRKSRFNLFESVWSCVQFELRCGVFSSGEGRVATQQISLGCIWRIRRDSAPCPKPSVTVIHHFQFTGRITPSLK